MPFVVLDPGSHAVGSLFGDSPSLKEQRRLYMCTAYKGPCRWNPGWSCEEVARYTLVALDTFRTIYRYGGLGELVQHYRAPSGWTIPSLQEVIERAGNADAQKQRDIDALNKDITDLENKIREDTQRLVELNVERARKIADMSVKSGDV
jgi:hypothetical protein